PSTNKRKRGGTQMQNVHGRSEHKLIVLNELNQPIGSTESIVKKLGSFLGTLARNGTFCPVNVLDWRKLKIHDDMWSYIREDNFYAYDDGETQMAKRPQNVSEIIFKDLLEYWKNS
ncbi:hypothetical protein HAX54_043817, partial [Datura stramonium]|nr:hypothetical protein [Datura stramonium]